LFLRVNDSSSLLRLLTAYRPLQERITGDGTDSRPAPDKSAVCILRSRGGSGGFYDGALDQFQWTGAWNLMPLFTVEFTGERDVGRLPSGRFVQMVIGNRVRINVSRDLSIASYVQYDTDSDSIGVNTRLRWTFRPVADLFVVYNHNVRSVLDHWRLDSNQLLVKLQYAWRL
jgi:hypothetical protein